jgi:hypothetical protein
MEKRAIIHPDVTPDLTADDKVKSAKDCAKTNIVDNCGAAVRELDADFRKAAADKVKKALDS